MMPDVDVPESAVDEMMLAADDLGWVGWVRMRIVGVLGLLMAVAFPDPVLEALWDAVQEEADGAADVADVDDRGRWRTFRVVRTGDTRLDVDGDVLGWGVQLPSDWCVIDWNREAFPEEDRLEFPHLSQYGCLDDVEQGAGGDVVDVQEVV